jgi:putative tryptophan/tyrosine transport system substrate-binding protein
MKRREFITLVGGTAFAWPLSVSAQQPDRIRRVGVLLGTAEKDAETNARLKAFRLSMRDLGWIDGRNVRIEYRFAGSNTKAIEKYVTELIGLAPDVIVANSTPVVAAIKPATTTIPIVFVIVNNPVGQGFVSNLTRPGANITGFSFLEPEIVGKWINLLQGAKPDLSHVTLMFSPNSAPYYDGYVSAFKALPQQPSVKLDKAHVRNIAEINAVVAQVAGEPGSALIAAGDPFILDTRGAILEAAARNKVPLISPYRFFTIEGSLMSYGPDTADIFRRSASYVDRILKGESPGNLPVQAPDKYELVINLKTAKLLGLSVSESFVELADEVIE